jgi:hypothetical protein
VERCCPNTLQVTCKTTIPKRIVSLYENKSCPKPLQHRLALRVVNTDPQTIDVLAPRKDVEDDEIAERRPVPLLLWVSLHLNPDEWVWLFVPVRRITKRA